MQKRLAIFQGIAVVFLVTALLIEVVWHGQNVRRMAVHQRALPAASTLSLNDLKMCNRKTIVYQPEPEPPVKSEPEPDFIPAENLRVGEDAYTTFLTVKDGLLYVWAREWTLFQPNSVDINQHIRRVKDGFLFDCETAQPFVEPWEHLHGSPLIPVVGTFRSKKK